MSDSDDVTMYRCERCGKWSHAQRKPRWHQRLTTEDPADTGAVELEYLAPSTDPDSDDGEGWIVQCGPFAAWTATKDPA